MTTPPFQLYLTGHDRWIGVCHEEWGMCPRCLRAVARALARDLDWDLRRALDLPIAAYAEEIGITDEQGAELRRLAVIECILRGAGFDGFGPGTVLDNLLLADELGPAKERAA